MSDQQITRGGCSVSDKSLIYLASPYSHADPVVCEKRYQAVLTALVHFIREGHLIYSPIVHNHQTEVILRGERNQNFGFEYWQDFDERMIRSCDEVWVLMLDGWQESRGVSNEVRFAEKIGLPVKWWKWEGA